MESTALTIRVLPNQDRPKLLKLLKDREATGIKLNLGCGFNHLAGCTNVDNNPECFPDECFDIEAANWPFESDSVQYACAVNVFEHVKDLLGVLGELWRVCAHEAKVEIIVPACFHQAAFEDPTHRRFFGASSWQYFDAEIYRGNTGWYSADRFHFITEQAETVIDEEGSAELLEDLAILSKNRNNSPALISFLRRHVQLFSIGIVSHYVYRMHAVKPLPPSKNAILNKYE